MNNLNRPLNEAELDELEELLLSLGEQIEEEKGEEADSVLCLSELDGFFTALISGPDAVLPSEWLPALWGGESPVYADEKQAQRTLNLLMRYMNDVASVLHDDPESYEPMFSYSVVDEVEYEIVDEWCYGYLRGVELREDQWRLLLDESPELLNILALFGSEAGWDELKKIEQPEQAELRSMIPSVAREIHAFWLQRRAVPIPLKRATPKTGRNEPCPCGSGKKYKQCCLH